MKKTRTGLKLVQVKSLYNAGLKGYQQSYAMMVDDAMNAMDCKAKDLGYNVGIYSDAGLLPSMYRFIKEHKSWDNVPVATKSVWLDLSKY